MAHRAKRLQKLLAGDRRTSDRAQSSYLKAEDAPREASVSAWSRSASSTLASVPRVSSLPSSLRWGHDLHSSNSSGSDG
jgi:hypothetical protein